MSSQQGQPAVSFNALRPATWGSLKLLPQALKSKLTGTKGADDNSRVPLAGKENAFQYPTPPAAPPKIADISHLQSIGPRRNVSQRYALQPNLNVNRQAAPAAQGASGLSGLLLPTGQGSHHHQLNPQPSQQQRSATPTSPTTRGRVPLGFAQVNPIFSSSQSNVSTRLPTPVRINSASPSSSSTNPAPALPRPPTPSRIRMANTPGSAGSSPIFANASTSGFTLPVPPALLPSKPLPWVPPALGQSQSQNQQQPAATTAPPRPPPAPAQERSILASIQLPSQQQQHQHQRAAAPAPSIQHHAQPAATAADAASAASPVAASVPAIQAALQQALQAAMERKPEVFQVDNFERLFDSMMHPGTASKLDGPLPHELPEDIRYSDKWHSHCRDWNSQNKPAVPYVVPASITQANAVDTASVPDQQQQPEVLTILDTAGTGAIASTSAPPNAATAAAVATATSPQQQALQMSQEAVAATPNAAVATAVCSSWLEFAEPAATEPLAEAPSPSPPTSADAQPTATMRKATGLRVVVDGLDMAALVPTAAEASITPTPPRSSARAPPSTATNTPTPGPRTPGGGAYSIASTAATTPAAAASHTAANTPTSGGGGVGAWLASADPFGDSAFSEAEGMVASAAASCASVPNSASVAVAAPAAAASATTEPETDVLLSMPPRSALSRSSVHAERDRAPLLQRPPVAARSSTASVPSAVAAAAPVETWSPNFSPIAPVAAPRPQPSVAAPSSGSAIRPPSPITLLHTIPRDAPTPIPAFFSSGTATANASGPAGLAAAVTAIADPSSAPVRDPAGPSTSTAPPAADPLKEIVVGIEKLSTLKQNILAEDKEVDVASITQMIQLKMAVEQLLKRTNTAAQAVVSAVVPSSTASGQAAATAAAAAPTGEQQVGTPKKKSATFGAFIKNMFSPKSNSASKAQAAAAATAAAAAPMPSIAAPAPGSASKRFFGANVTSLLNSSAAAAPTAAVPASPVAQRASSAAGFLGARPSSASALPRRAASPSPADRSRYATLHQKAAARLAEAAAEPGGARSILASAGAPAAGPLYNQQHQQPQQQPQRGDLLRRYEEKIAVHRHQLDATKSQLDEALRKLNDMQTEFDELLLCLGMESAKNQALCEAMRAAGLDPE
ncbi:hypothetical protein Agub_g9458, partial [Astrephomene gubernaculifera]